MNNIKNIFLFMAFFSFSFTIQAANTLSSGNFQIVSGGCNIVLNVVNSTIPKITPTYCPQLSAVKGAADALVKIERYIEASNPTKIEMSGAQIEHWIGDSEDYLTITISNSSNLPANKVNLQLLEPVKPGELFSRKISFTPSQGFPKTILDTLAVPSKETIKIPIAPASELIQLLKDRVPNGFELLGVGLAPNMPPETIENYVQKHGIHNGYSSHSTSTSLGLEIKFETIFGGKVRILTGLYMYFGIVLPTQASSSLLDGS